MEHPNELTFYVLCYYSVTFHKHAHTDRMARYKNLFEKMKTAFPNSVDAQKVLHRILDALLGKR